ncbi:VTT domain-containing protein [Nocardioides sp. zg-536]|uniref:VTT domain-containing protein n=1 Tax=Nocardioides faecalis TaxID=2803858 RepID=A0A938Y708_9ACTN|nr:VTT domain-containing protein [Nocardioides faecalis]MBM9460364.1 VTT domain-containing protein [Nocardioides faecalis]MBS4751289.1 VTT domain-containing protein [Nocardioides faecalis]QVI59808.1 VTT domain-containing protein [Nocardioides faecalis]
MILVLTTFVFSIASALLPFLPIEVYIVGAASSDRGFAEALVLGAAAGAGATIGKIIWYEAARRGIDSAWAQKKLSKPKVRASYEKWTERMRGRPWYGVAIMFVAATLGVPPLLAMAAVGGILKMPLWAFVPAVFVGRTIRFTALFLGVDLALH